MHVFRTGDKPGVYAGIAVVSLMILTGLTLAGTAVVLTVMIPVFVVLSPILVPAVITSTFLATGFVASGSLGASAIALLVWIYKKEEYFRSNMHERVPPEGAKGDKPPEEVRPPVRDITAEEFKSTERDRAEEHPSEKDKLSEIDNMAEEIQSTGRDNAEEYKPSEKDKLSERVNDPADEDTRLGGLKHADIEKKGPAIPAEIISKVFLAEQNSIGSKRSGPGTLRKRSHQLGFAMDPAKRYNNLFERNAKTGSFYLQSKVHRAKECLEAAYQKKPDGITTSA